MAELTTESGTNPDSGVVDECIAKADAEIDSYLGVKYTVPFSTVPARVESLSQDIAIYYLFTRRSVTPEMREINYKNAIAYLRDVAAGKAVLIDGSTEASGGSKQAPQLVSAATIFNRNSMTSW